MVTMRALLHHVAAGLASGSLAVDLPPTRVALRGAWRRRRTARGHRGAAPRRRPTLHRQHPQATSSPLASDTSPSSPRADKPTVRLPARSSSPTSPSSGTSLTSTASSTSAAGVSFPQLSNPIPARKRLDLAPSDRQPVAYPGTPRDRNAAIGSRRPSDRGDRLDAPARSRRAIPSAPRSRLASSDEIGTGVKGEEPGY